MGLIRRMAVGAVATAGTLPLIGVTIPLHTESPEQVIRARKGVMRAIKANAVAIGVAARSGDLDAVNIHAEAVAALAGTIPFLFQEEFPRVYPIMDSRFRLQNVDYDNMLGFAGNLRDAARASRTQMSCRR